MKLITTPTTIIILILLSSFVSADLLTNLESYYTFDVDATDDVGSNDLTVHNAQHNTTDSKLGAGCYYFNSNDHLFANINIPSITSSWCGWYQTYNLGVAQIPMNVYVTDTTDEIVRILYNAGDQLDVFNDYAVSLLNIETMTNNVYEHICVIHEPNSVKVYVNATLVGTDNAIGVFPNALQIKLGERADNATDFFGRIDEVGIWTRNLTLSEIQSLYNSGAGLPLSSFGSDYYYSQSGSDVNSCNITHPCKTITDLNTQTLVAGDSIYFNRGDEWFFPDDAYPNLVSGLTIADYGTGHQPQFYGAVNCSGPGNWTDMGNNRWRCDVTTAQDSGHVAGDGNIVWGNKTTTFVGVTSTGHFFSNTTGDDKTTVYATANPGSTYNNLLVAQKTTMFDYDGMDNIRFENLTVKNTGQHAFAGNTVSDITVRYCNIDMVGGSYQALPTRFGNCIETYQGAVRSLFENNTVNRCYDAGITAQSNNAVSINDTIIRYNVISNTYYGIEYFNSHANAQTHNLSIHHNTIANQYDSFNSNRQYSRVRLASNPLSSSNINITDNIYYNSTYRSVAFQNWANIGSTQSDYNLYYLNSGTKLIMYNISNYNTVVDFNMVLGFESNGLETNPLFKDYATFAPSITSPACGGGSGGSDIGAIPCSATSNTNISFIQPQLSAKSFIDTFEYYNLTYLFTTDRWIDVDGNYSLGLYNNGFGTDSNMLFRNQTLNHYDYAYLSDFNYTNFEAMVKVTQLENQGSGICSVNFIDGSITYLRSMLYDSGKIYYRGEGAATYIGVDQPIGDPIYFKFVVNNSVMSQYYATDIEDYKNNWSLMTTYFLTMTPNTFQLATRLGACAFDNVIIREIDKTEGSGILYPSFIFDSTNNSDWSLAQVNYYKDSIKNASVNFTTPTDFIDYSRELTTGSWYINVTLCDIHNVCRTEISDTVNINFANLYKCSVLGDPTLNVTIAHEDYPTTATIITDVEVAGTTWFIDDPTDTNSYNFSFSGDDTYEICMYPPQESIQTDMYIKYTTANGFTHRYYYVNHTLTNTLQYLTIYNFNYTTGISDLVLTLRNKNNYQYFTNVVTTLQRHYVGENTWRTVQMDESGSFGRTFFNIYEENSDYRLVFLNRDGNYVIETTESMKFICTGGVCELTYLLDPDRSTTTKDNFTISHDLDNNTGILRVSWNDPDNQPFTINSIVRRVAFNQSLIICNQTTTDTVSGYQDCNLTGLTGVFQVKVKTSRSPWSYQSSEWFEIQTPRIGALIGTADATFWSFGILTVLLFFGAIISPIAAIITVIVGLILLFYFSMLNVITITFILTVSVMGVLLGLKIRN